MVSSSQVSTIQTTSGFSDRHTSLKFVYFVKETPYIVIHNIELDKGRAGQVTGFVGGRVPLPIKKYLHQVWAGMTLIVVRHWHLTGKL